MADLDRGLAHTRLLLERSSLLPHVAENHARLSKGHNNSFYSKKEITTIFCEYRSYSHGSRVENSRATES